MRAPKLAATRTTIATGASPDRLDVRIDYSRGRPSRAAQPSILAEPVLEQGEGAVTHPFDVGIDLRAGAAELDLGAHEPPSSRCTPMSAWATTHGAMSSVGVADSSASSTASRRV